MRRFSQVDVFTDEFMKGNALAVVHDAEGLSTEEMTAFANWTNLAETTFLLPPRDPAADYRVRIFTTSRELPFAGHPTLGSARAWLDAGNTPREPGRLVQECGAGLVEVRRDGARLAFAAPPLVRGEPVEDVDGLAAALAIRPDEIVQARWTDNGPGWVAVLLHSAEAVLAVRPDYTRFGEFTDIGVVGPHRDGGDAAFEVRAFVNEGGVFGEDPVTGSLNASIAQWLIPAEIAQQQYVAAQGTVLGRQGRIHLALTGGQVWVGGDTVVGITGTVALPPVR
ncbi:PhzF family phenazine biosynthesis protein [Lentzea sp. NBRC 102530]|uniref:PhzF family phenazine biosynthesis protein n=1 Tax=Lentzea sp. NBRC 102530 TaxID=3032201 RepID=UPI0024A090AF|nr:PhzF family phenazine biosynthesis protein [Lentzea sp. NBRC 102530]GLY51460.1 phenazine biosynthesis protein PhzF [Lentzea sp. NBRC 102530]